MWNSSEIVRALMVHLSSKTAVCVLGFAAGAGSSYLALNKTLKTKYEKLSEHEIDEARRFYKRGDYSDPVKALEKFKAEEQEIDREEELEKAAKMMKELNYNSDNEFRPAPHVEKPAKSEEELDEPVIEVNVQNIFVDGNPLDADFDYEEELKKRSEDYPYIITHDEYFESGLEYSQNRLTYFQDDDFLLDDEDNILPESDPLVGDDNLLRFGAGSKDPNIVYIRNDRLEIDFEVVLAKGSYVQQVYGVEDEETIEHSYSRRPRKMRSADE